MADENEPVELSCGELERVAGGFPAGVPGTPGTSGGGTSAEDDFGELAKNVFYLFTSGDPWRWIFKLNPRTGLPY